MATGRKDRVREPQTRKWIVVVAGPERNKQPIHWCRYIGYSVWSHATSRAGMVHQATTTITESSLDRVGDRQIMPIH